MAGYHGTKSSGPNRRLPSLATREPQSILWLAGPQDIGFYTGTIPWALLDSVCIFVYICFDNVLMIIYEKLTTQGLWWGPRFRKFSDIDCN